MKKRLSVRRIVIFLTGVLFAVYSVYNVFLIVRDKGRGMPVDGQIISAVVAFIFAVLAAFMWTSEVNDLRVIVIRKTALVISLIVLFLLKLRLLSRMIDYIEVSTLYTVLYGVIYVLTLLALFVLFFYYTVILKNRPRYPKAAFFLPLSSALLFLCCLILEMIVFVVYDIGAEANELRTLIIRPVFYLGFIGLSMYFALPPKRKN